MDRKNIPNPVLPNSILLIHPNVSIRDDTSEYSNTYRVGERKNGEEIFHVNIFTIGYNVLISHCIQFFLK